MKVNVMFPKWKKKSIRTRVYYRCSMETEYSDRPMARSTYLLTFCFDKLPSHK